MKTPALFINFKTYREATGENAITLAKLAEEAASKNRATVCLVVQAVDIKPVSEAVSLPTYAQHIDPIAYGKHAGHTLPEGVKAAGAEGTVLNHPERPLGARALAASVERAKDAGLEVMACAESVARAKEIAELSPDIISVEIPGLIGGTVSISDAKPDLISGAVNAIAEVSKKINVVTGAGIRNTGDVKKAIGLGVEGVFVSSAIVTSQDPKQAIERLLQGFPAH